jgi:hypothetical protein
MKHIYHVFQHSNKINKQYQSIFLVYFLTILTGLLENGVQNISKYGTDRMHA